MTERPSIATTITNLETMLDRAATLSRMQGWPVLYEYMGRRYAAEVAVLRNAGFHDFAEEYVVEWRRYAVATAPVSSLREDEPEARR